MINSPFFTQFLRLSNVYTLVALLLLGASIFFLRSLGKKKVSFSNRMLIGLVLGLALGILLDVVGANNALYANGAQKEISDWFALLGSGFIKLVQLLAVPVVFLSIIKVITDVDAKRIKTLTSKTFIVLLGTTAVSAVVGIVVVKLFNLESINLVGELSAGQIDRMGTIASQSFPQFFLGFIPNNMMSTFSSNGQVVSTVIIGALFAASLRFLSVKKPEQVKPFIDLLDSARLVINSMLINVIKFMPYGVLGLVANTIISRGVAAIIGMGGFIIALYVGVIIMLLFYVVLLTLTGISPVVFFKKAFTTLVFAFSSRSSVGTLPYTLQTLENDMGVSGSTANFVATLGTSIGMNGCAGLFPAMLGILVAASAGIEINFVFYVMLVLVVTIGSIGIAGVPGTATVAATVTLNGIGLGELIPNIGAVFGIDPIVDMGRTMLNVAGAMVAAVIIDKWDGTFNQDEFNAVK